MKTCHLMNCTLISSYPPPFLGSVKVNNAFDKGGREGFLPGRVNGYIPVLQLLAVLDRTGQGQGIGVLQ